MRKIKIKKAVKIFGWIGSGSGILLVVLWTGFFIWDRFDEARIAKDVERALATREAAEIEAGETPMETFSLFLDALRDDALDRATQYFAPELRQGWRRNLQSIKDAELLDTMIADLENTEEDAPLTEEHFREMNGRWHLVSF